jgi:hypothetical protein
MENKQIQKTIYEKSRTTTGIFGYFKIKNTLDFFDFVSRGDSSKD